MLKDMIRNKKMKYDLSNHLDNIKSALVDAGVDMKGKAGEVFSRYYSEFGDKAEEARDDLVDYIEESPLKAVGIATGVGVVIGLLLGRLK